MLQEKYTLKGTFLKKSLKRGWFTKRAQKDKRGQAPLPKKGGRLAAMSVMTKTIDILKFFGFIKHF